MSENYYKNIEKINKNHKLWDYLNRSKEKASELLSDYSALIFKDINFFDQFCDFMKENEKINTDTLNTMLNENDSSIKFSRINGEPILFFDFHDDNEYYVISTKKLNDFDFIKLEESQKIIKNFANDYSYMAASIYTSYLKNDEELLDLRIKKFIEKQKDFMIENNASLSEIIYEACSNKDEINKGFWGKVVNNDEHLPEAGIKLETYLKQDFPKPKANRLKI